LLTLPLLTLPLLTLPLLALTLLTLSPPPPARPQDWTTIESDPGVFTSLVSKFGSSGVEFEELYALEDDMLPADAHGLIFLFKYSAAGQRDDDGKYRALTAEDVQVQAPSLFFAKQVVQNACATQAILSILLNVDKGGWSGAFETGAVLEDLKSFCGDFPADMKGEMSGMQVGGGGGRDGGGAGGG
jgi:ubiquitin carboxyl-terminal hydrolase L5